MNKEKDPVLSSGPETSIDFMEEKAAVKHHFQRDLPAGFWLFQNITSTKES